MISSKFKFIFLHVPKTGGNSLQSALLPFSDDKKKISQAHHDEVNRFAVSGPITDNKHATLQFYTDALGAKIADYKVVLSRRHPFARAVSFYYSPHRWFQKHEDGSSTPIEPYWDEASFFQLLPRLSSMVQFITVDGRVRKPDIEIRIEHMKEDCRRAFSVLQIPGGADLRVPRVNKSSATSELVAACLASRSLRDAVEQHFVDDMNYFDYPSYSAEIGSIQGD